MRAMFQGQPYNMFKPENYELWKEIDINFEAKEVFGG
jgi:hypothetical protein